MRTSVAIDDRLEWFELPDKNLQEILLPNEHTSEGSESAILERALARPIGTERLASLVKPGEKIAIVTSDLTRPVPSYKILPYVLNELSEAGCRDQDITIVFALGSHRKQTEAERRRLVGDAVFDRVRCIDGDAEDVVHMGRTALGTDVDVVRPVAEADRRVCLGNIEYHYFAGYSGGAKAIMPGVSTRMAIQNNHSRMVEADAHAGKLEGNPVRKDIEEAILYCPIDFIVNVVLDEHKNIVHASAGHYIKAHRDGCAYLDGLYAKKIAKRADIVIVSQGGKPKDLNLYQTQKALDNSKHAVRQGGVIILVGSCKEGMGESVFESWMLKAKKPSDLVERIKREFVLGGHKAAAIGMVMAEATIYLVSDLSDDFVRSIFMRPFHSVQAALDEAFATLGAEASVIVMPYGGSTLPQS